MMQKSAKTFVRLSLQNQPRHFSWLGGMFGGKKPEDDKPKEAKKQPVVVQEEEAPVAPKVLKVDIPDDLRDQVRSLSRSGPQNMYSQVPKTRLTKKERNSEEHLHSFINSGLLENSRVKVEKFDVNTFSRGLPEDEAPFPVQPKIGPYVVSFYFSNNMILDRQTSIRRKELLLVLLWNVEEITIL